MKDKKTNRFPVKFDLKEQAENNIKAFKEAEYWTKVKRFAKNAGVQPVYASLLMIYAFRRKDTPAWAKQIILGALAYFLAPIDAIPDLTPFLGFTDDLGVFSFGLVAIAAHVNDEVRVMARERLKSWFGEVDESQLDAVEEKL